MCYVHIQYCHSLLRGGSSTRRKCLNHISNLVSTTFAPVYNHSRNKSSKSQADLWLIYFLHSDWTPADLFSVGSQVLGWISIMQLGGAGLLPWGGTVAGLKSAYHGHKSPSLQAPQKEGTPCPLQSRDKPPSCWENQILSPPERIK